MLILDSGILLALSLSCGYKFEVWEVEPLCTPIKAETGDRALTSWWAVKLGRNQQINIHIYIYTSESEISLIIQLKMSLLQQYFAWDFSKKFRLGIGHINVCSLLITIPLSNRASGFAMEHFMLPGSLDQASVKNPSLLSQHPPRESIVLLYCFVKGSCLTSVNMFRHCPCYRSIINTLEWKKEDDLWADPSILSMLPSVMEVLDLSLLDISIWTWEWNSSW